MNRLLASIACTAMLVSVSACAPKVETPLPEAPASACRELYRAIDTRVEQAGVGDAQSARVAGYPYLRTDRFLAAADVKPDAGSDAFDAWVDRLRSLDSDARRAEIRNLPNALEVGLGEEIHARLEDCADLLASSDLKSVEDRHRLLSIASVADDYSVAKRVVGLYPFTSLPFKAGVEDLHESMQLTFSRPLESLPVEGRLLRYRPPPESLAVAAPSVRGLLQAAERDPLGIPALSADDRRRLFDAYAPVYEIDVVSDDDRPGEPFWNDDGTPAVDVGRPVVFRRFSYTRFEGRTLLQLNYSVWFPSRPSDGNFDLRSGHLDGITFRVTLGGDGRPLVYDSMHNCGCYHLFVPTTRLSRKPPSGGHEEPPLVPQTIGVEERRVVLRIAHRSHYLQRVYFDTSAGEDQTYALRDDDSLRSLPLADGERRSLFAPDGLVIGSERGERWLFWPMGIAEPGAMRQWGRHATAFVGTRHFDDPDLIERYFVSAD